MASRGRLALALSCLLAAACSSPTATFVARTWPADHTVVVVLADADGAPLDDGVLVFAPSEVIRFDLAPRTAVRVHVVTFAPEIRAPDGRSLVDCGVTLAGSGPLLPSPATRWATKLVDLGAASDLVLEPETVSMGYALRYGCTIDPCAGYAATRVEAGAGFRSRAVAAIDDEHALFGGYTGAGARAIVAVEGETTRVVEGTAWLTNYLRDLAFDGDAAVWGVMEGGARYRLDVHGGEATSFGARPRLDRLWVAAGGTLIGLDHDSAAWELSPTSTRAVARSDLPPDVHDLAVMRPDRLFMRDASAIYFFDGQRWAKEHDTSAVENVSGMGGDDDVMVVVGALEVIRVRDEKTHVFELFPRPFDLGARLRGVSGLGGGRFLVAGEHGALAAWTGTAWCPFPELVDVALVRISVAPSKRVAWVAGDNDTDGQSRPVAVKVDVPPLGN